MQDRVLWFCRCGVIQKERERGRAKQQRLCCGVTRAQSPFSRTACRRTYATEISARLGDEGAADSGAAPCGRLRVGLVQDDAHGRKNRDVQDCVELVGKIVGFFQQERYTAIA